VLAGNELWCQFFSEPEAGSDLAAVQTRADRDGDGWVITGSKIWSSGAHLADWGMCLARTDWSLPKHRGLTWFAVPTDAPGLTIRQIKQINGSREFCQEFFDSVRVPDINCIGEVNAGWTVTGTLLVFERGAGRPGTPENPDGPGEIDGGLLKLAERAGRKDDALVIDALVRAHCGDYVVRQLKARIETMVSLGKVSPGVAAYGKLAVSQQAASKARIGMEIGGDATVAWDPGLALDACGAEAATEFMGSKALAIAGGTEQMQRNGIAERVLGLPREPAADLDVGFDEMLRRQRAARTAGPGGTGR
jgi:alkylation response protein AidB-like acyl-CoA dehydrogenase